MSYRLRYVGSSLELPRYVGLCMELIGLQIGSLFAMLLLYAVSWSETGYRYVDSCLALIELQKGCRAVRCCLAVHTTHIGDLVHQKLSTENLYSD